MWRRSPQSAYLDPIRSEFKSDRCVLSREEALGRFKSHAILRLKHFIQVVIAPQLPGLEEALLRQGQAVLIELKARPDNDQHRQAVAARLFKAWCGIAPELGTERERIEGALADHVCRSRRSRRRGRPIQNAGDIR